MDLLRPAARSGAPAAEALMRGTAVVVAAALVAVTVLGLYHLLGHPPGRYSAWRVVAQIVVLSAAWLLTNGPLEGRVLWVPLRSHGLSQGDLAVAPPLVVAAVLAVLTLRR